MSLRRSATASTDPTVARARCSNAGPDTASAPGRAANATTVSDVSANAAPTQTASWRHTTSTRSTRASAGSMTSTGPRRPGRAAHVFQMTRSTALRARGPGDPSGPRASAVRKLRRAEWGRAAVRCGAPAPPKGWHARVRSGDTGAPHRSRAPDVSREGLHGHHRTRRTPDQRPAAQHPVVGDRRPGGLEPQDVLRRRRAAGPVGQHARTRLPGPGDRAGHRRRRLPPRRRREALQGRGPRRADGTARDRAARRRRRRQRPSSRPSCSSTRSSPTSCARR